MFTSGYSFGEGDIVLPDDLKAELVKRGKLRIWLKIIEHYAEKVVYHELLATETGKALNAACDAAVGNDRGAAFAKLDAYTGEREAETVAKAKKKFEELRAAIVDDNDAAQAYIKEHDESLYEEGVDGCDRAFSEGNFTENDSLDADDPIRRRVAEAVLSAHIDKYGIKRKTLDTLKADYPTAAALILFLREIIQDPEGVDELYDRFDLFNEIEHSME